MSQVIDGAGRAGEMEDVVDRAVDLDGLGDVMFDEPKPGPIGEVLNVARAAGQQIVDADHLIAVVEKPLAEM